MRLIVNPVAGADAGADYLTTINARLRAHRRHLDIVMTTGPGDAARAGAQAAEAGYSHLFVAGGDGTLNEAINGVASVPDGLDRITFGVVPLGTGNDFATALGLPAEVDAALDVLATASTRRIDLGRLNEWYFVNVSAGGFIAEVSDAVRPQLKTVAGKLAYLIGGAQTILSHSAIRARIRLKEGGRSLGGSPAVPPAEAVLETFAVCNSRLVGGGRLIAPEAEFDDGELDVCLIHDMPMVEFVRLLRRVSDGAHVEDSRVTYFRARDLEMRFDRPVKVNVDGQVLETDVCRYRVLPGAAQFLAGPREPTTTRGAFL
jgi:diacylglycerol kinase (ATP)